ncbi:hypothetical protein ACFQJD_14315 [Haloplanus sp. GCM10025708]
MRTAGVKRLPVVPDGDPRGLLSAAALGPYLSRHSLGIEWRGGCAEGGEDRGLVASD